MSEFKITGPGEYRTRGGEKVKVIANPHKESIYPWITLDEYGHYDWCHYTHGKVYSDIENDYDIVGPWIEPTNTTKPTYSDHAKLIASLELAAHHNDCAELLLEAASTIRDLTAKQPAVRVSWANP